MPIAFHCRNCGKSLRAPDGAEGRRCRCSSCGLETTVSGERFGNERDTTYPLAEVTKDCPYCGERIKPSAKKCRYCGTVLNSVEAAQMQPVPPAQVAYMQQTSPAQGPSGGVAAVLSFLIPGLGQLYKGQVFGGLVWFLAVPVGYVLFIVPGLVLHLLCVLSAASEVVPSVVGGCKKVWRLDPTGV